MPCWLSCGVHISSAQLSSALALVYIGHDPADETRLGPRVDASVCLSGHCHLQTRPDTIRSSIANHKDHLPLAWHIQTSRTSIRTSNETRCTSTSLLHTILSDLTGYRALCLPSFSAVRRLPSSVSLSRRHTRNQPDSKDRAGTSDVSLAAQRRLCSWDLI